MTDIVGAYNLAQTIIDFPIGFFAFDLSMNTDRAFVESPPQSKKRAVRQAITEKSFIP